MSYWRERYGLQTRDFILGVIAGVEAYAVWKDGSQHVGIREHYLSDVIEEIKQDLGWEHVTVLSEQKEEGGELCKE